MEAGSTTGTSNLAAFDAQSAATQWAAQGIAPWGSLIAQAQRPSPRDAVIRRRARAGAIDSAQ
jgi:hypothetical protein